MGTVKLNKVCQGMVSVSCHTVVLPLSSPGAVQALCLRHVSSKQLTKLRILTINLFGAELANLNSQIQDFRILHRYE